MTGAETESFTGALYEMGMDRRLVEWKLDIERIWSAAAPDYWQAACLADDMIRFSEETVLRQAATQAFPILRSASIQKTDHAVQDAARRRLGVLREALHTLATPQFGKRQTEAKSLTPEEGYRQMLGLPFGRSLSRAEIHRAYKHVAKRAHPDAGGTAQEFQELSAARDALIERR
jgi:hypothetical protein